MTAIGDVFQVTLSATYLGQLINNVFMYRINDTPSTGAVQGLVTDFISDMLPTIQTLQDDSLAYIRVTAINLFDPSDLWEEALAVYGTQACVAVTASSPSFLAIHTRLIRDNARVDNGAKYWAGLCENFVSENAIVGLDSPLNLLDTQLAADLNPGSVDTFQPVLVKRVRTTASRVNSFGQTVSYYKYRLPNSSAEMDDNWSIIRSAQSSRVVSHMLSRQAGRGI